MNINDVYGDDGFEGFAQEWREVSARMRQAVTDVEKLENGKRSMKAHLMKKAEAAGYKTIAAQEREAYASDEYKNITDPLAHAKGRAIQAQYDLKLLDISYGYWRTKESSQRSERKHYNAD